MIVSLSLLILVSVNLAYAQSSGLYASTDKQSYEPGEQVTLTGSISQIANRNPVTIIVRNPIGNVYEVGQVELANDRFEHDFVLNDNAQGGIYTVNVRQDDKTTQIQFQVVAGQTQIIPVFDSENRVSGNNTGFIKYGNVEISTKERSVTISLNASGIQNGSVVEEYHVPKRVIDSIGGPLVVKENSGYVDCKQSDVGAERVLDCPVKSSTNEISFIGTSVIPEFGPGTASVLALGVMVALVVVSRNLFSCRIR